MRLEATKKSDEYNVWLTDDDLDRLRCAAASHRDDLILQLGGYRTDGDVPNLARTTLMSIHKDDERRQWYLGAEADDERVAAALAPIES